MELRKLWSFREVASGDWFVGNRGRVSRLENVASRRRASSVTVENRIDAGKALYV